MGLSYEQRLNLVKNARQQLMASIELKKQLMVDNYLDTLVSMAENIVRSLANGGKLMLCGNGGSAADAQHLACELLVRIRSSKNRPSIPAISLALDSSTITGCSNDYGFEYLYERMIQGLGQQGDVLLGISTSGKSTNVIRALGAAQKKGITTLGFLGSDGRETAKTCDLKFIVPSFDPCRVQEMHIVAGHILMDLIEDLMIEKKHIELVSDTIKI